MVTNVRQLKKVDYRSWWDKANECKMKGFYVDYKKGEWKSPEEIDQKVYEEAHPIAGQYIKALLNVKELLENAELK